MYAFRQLQDAMNELPTLETEQDRLNCYGFSKSFVALAFLKPSYLVFWRNITNYYNRACIAKHC